MARSRTLTCAKLVVGGLALLTLGACGGGGGATASANPNFFTADIDDARLTGRYNPAGFSSAEVQQALSGNCTGGRLASYGEQKTDALVAFTATCEGGPTAAGGTIEIEKAGGSVSVESMTYDENGTLSTQQRAI